MTSALSASFCLKLAKAGGRLTLREAIILHRVLTTQEVLTATDLARTLIAPQPSISRCIARLEFLGFIRRTRGHANTRALLATVKGRELLM
jgi:DNA-binding MarR family transcriptional regulator